MNTTTDIQVNKTFEEAINFRHACKKFDESKKVSDEDIRFILNAGRISPSSYGLETSRYIVISNEQLKENIKNVSYGQEQVSNCSHLVIVISSIIDAKIDSGIPRERFERLNMPKENIDFFLDMYSSYVDQHLYTDEKIYAWASKQAYIGVGNIMTAAAVKGVDSCAIEGFEKEKVEELLDLDTSKEQVSLVLPLGYRVRDQREQIRLDFDKVVQFIA